MKKRYLSILLSLSLGLSNMPAIAFAGDGAPAANSSETDVEAQAVDYSKIYTDSRVTTTGDGSEASPFKTFEEALAAVDAGGTIIIKGQGYLNDSANGGNGDHPLIISKELTIQGESDAENTTASFNIRAGGFVLGADVTIKNLELGFSGMVRPAIFVNGHTLTAETVSIDKSAGKGTAHIFAGGYSSASATAGSGTEILLKNCSFGNIYAGGMGEAYDEDVSVTLNGTCKIDAIYGYGATDINTSNESYGTSGKLTVTLSNTPKGFKESNTTIDGTGAKSTDVSVKSTLYGKTLSLKKITNFSTQSDITIDSLDTPTGSMNIALNSNAKLNLLNSTGNSFGALTGAGTLQIGTLQSLTFASVEGSHILETLTSDGIQGTAAFGIAYITQNGGSGTFTLAKDCTGALMNFEKEGNEWKTSSSVTISNKVSKFSFTETTKTMSGSDFQTNGLIIPVSWTHQMLGNEVASLSHIPLDYEVSYNSGTPVTKKSVLDINGMYEASLQINGATLAFTAADKNTYEEDTPENIDRIELHSSSALSAGVYKITVTAPTNSDPISDTFTLTVTDGSTPPASGQKETITTDMFELSNTSAFTYDGDDHLQAIKERVTILPTYKDKIGNVTVTVKDAESNKAVEKATDAGAYDIYISCAGNEQYNALPETKLGTINIAPKTIAVKQVFIYKTFNGSQSAPVSNITFDNATLNYGDVAAPDDYSATATFDNANAGTNKTASYTVTLLNKNYTFAGGLTYSGTQTGLEITKGEAPTSLPNVSENRKVGSKEEQTVTLKNVGMPKNAGTLTYALKTGNTGALTISETSSDTDSITYSVTKSDSEKLTISCSREGDTLTIKQAEGAAGTVFEIPVIISSTNYQDTTLQFILTIIAKAAPIVSADDITVDYTGNPISADKIQGRAITSNGNPVEGTWGWVGNAPQNVADSGSKQVEFTPKDSETFASATTNITVTILPIPLTGAPTYTEITGSGKTLKDANWTKNAAWGSGTLQWQDANGAALSDTTPVTLGTSYKWIFKPDNTNYTECSDTVILWKTTTGSNGGSGSSSKPSSGSSSSANSNTSSDVKVPVSSDHNAVDIKANVSQGTASVSINQNQINQVISEGKTNVAIDVSGLKDVDSAKLPANIISAANQADSIGLTVALPTGSVALDDKALASLPDNKDVTVSVEKVSPEALTSVQKAAIGEQAETAVVVDVNILVGKEKQSTFGSGKLTISVPYTPKADEDTSRLTVWFIRDDGSIENMGGSYDAEQQCFVFETEHLSQYILVNLKETTAKKTPIQQPETITTERKIFFDVPESVYYANAVQWAVSKGITSGISENFFAPLQSASRAEVVTFLWRAAGKPTATTPVHFDDVAANTYYSEAIRWAASNDIISGYENGLFGTNDPITREQMVAILYRFAQSCGMDTTQGGMAVREFLDYESLSGYARPAMQWAVNANILKGADGYLMPDALCTRAQIVSLLYRIYQ